MANQAAYRGLPVKMLNTVVPTWKAISKWRDAKYMQQMLGSMLPKVGVHHHPKFLYFHDRPLANLSGTTQHKTTKQNTNTT